MKPSLVLFAALAVVGCGSKAPAPAQQNPSRPVVRLKNGAPPVGGAGIAPMGPPGAAGMTPVANSDSVTGAGMGGVGQAAKNQARAAASKASEGAGASATGDTAGG